MKTAEQLADELEERSVRIPESGCRVWLGSAGTKGYGAIYDGNGMQYVHRVAWELANGRAIPRGLQILHKCDVRPCCNPDHLQMGTAKDNSVDMARKARSPHGERNGQAKLTSDAVRMIRTSPLSNTQIARGLGVSQSIISDIRRGVSWRHTR